MNIDRRPKRWECTCDLCIYICRHGRYDIYYHPNEGGEAEYHIMSVRHESGEFCNCIVLHAIQNDISYTDPNKVKLLKTTYNYLIHCGVLEGEYLCLD